MFQVQHIAAGALKTKLSTAISETLEECLNSCAVLKHCSCKLSAIECQENF